MLQGLRNIGQARETAHQEADGAVQQSVGDMLLARRVECGLDLQDVANVLRIRRPYLMAIEDSRLDDLPGATYAIGFVRAYAEHLGLDGPAVVERYKDETAALASAARLVFPSPLPEGKVPSGRILLFAVLALAVVYGGWVLLSSDDRRLAELVPALPDRFRALIGGDAADNANETPAVAPDPTPPATAAEPAMPRPVEKPATAATSEPTVAQSDTPDASPSLTTREAEPAPVIQPSEPLTVTPEAASAASNAAVSRIVAPEPESGAETPETSQPAAAPSEPPTADNATSDNATSENAASENVTSDDAASENATSDNAASDNAVATPETTPAAKASADNDVPQFGVAAARAAVFAALDPTPRAPPAAPAESAKEPREYGAENTDARVIIRATGDSWVQVRDKDGQLLLTRVLRVGDSYRVPNDAGVVMRTGNAGGLDIQVDGESVPGLGPKGAIRHEVVLDADRLKAGTAIRR